MSSVPKVLSTSGLFCSVWSPSKPVPALQTISFTGFHWPVACWLASFACGAWKEIKKQKKKNRFWKDFYTLWQSSWHHSTVLPSTHRVMQRYGVHGTHKRSQHIRSILAQTLESGIEPATLQLLANPPFLNLYSSAPFVYPWSLEGFKLTTFGFSRNMFNHNSVMTKYRSTTRSWSNLICFIDTKCH